MAGRPMPLLRFPCAWVWEAGEGGGSKELWSNTVKDVFIDWYANTFYSRPSESEITTLPLLAGIPLEALGASTVTQNHGSGKAMRRMLGFITQGSSGESTRTFFWVGLCTLCEWTRLWLTPVDSLPGGADASKHACSLRMCLRQVTRAAQHSTARQCVRPYLASGTHPDMATPHGLP